MLLFFVVVFNIRAVTKCFCRLPVNLKLFGKHQPTHNSVNAPKYLHATLNYSPVKQLHHISTFTRRMFTRVFFVFRVFFLLLFSCGFVCCWFVFV